MRILNYNLDIKMDINVENEFCLNYDFNYLCAEKVWLDFKVEENKR
jgi:hypothetical protein